MSRKGPFILFRLIGLLLVIGLIAGAGVMSYKAGFSQGVSQAPAVATAISKAAEKGVAPVPPMYSGYGYGPGYYPYPYSHPHGFFPFGAICGSIFFLFFFFGFMKMMFFRRMMWGGHHGGHHGPPWMRNHDHNCEGKQDGENKESDKKDDPEEKK